MIETGHGAGRETGHHRVGLRVAVGALRLEVAVMLAAPWTVLFGPSGSGKSSVLRGMCGLLSTPARGVEFARWEEGRWCELGGVRVAGRRIAYAPQGGAVFPHMTVERNVGFAGGDAALVEEALAMFALGGVRRKMPGEISGGERQRVALARAFAVPEARLLLVDEPFTGMDRGLRDALIPRLRGRMAERGVPVVSVTHDVEEALRLEAEVVRVVKGRAVAQGEARVVLAEEAAAVLRVVRG